MTTPAMMSCRQRFSGSTSETRKIGGKTPAQIEEQRLSRGVEEGDARAGVVHAHLEIHRAHAGRRHFAARDGEAVVEEGDEGKERRQEESARPSVRTIEAIHKSATSTLTMHEIEADRDDAPRAHARRARRRAGTGSASPQRNWTSRPPAQRPECAARMWEAEAASQDRRGNRLCVMASRVPSRPRGRSASMTPAAHRRRRRGSRSGNSADQPASKAPIMQPAEERAGERADAAEDRRDQRLQLERRREAVADRAVGMPSSSNPARPASALGEREGPAGSRRGLTPNISAATGSSA